MVGVKLLRIAAVYMVVGLALGLAIGISGQYPFATVHSHLSLLGWVTMAIAGFAYLLMPACARSRLAALHFWGHNIGLPVMIAGLAVKTNGLESAEPVVAGGSVLVLASLVLFAVNLLRNGKWDPGAYYGQAPAETKETGGPELRK